MKNTKDKRVTMDELATLRDELRVQAHLFKSDMQSNWQTLEKDWKKFKAAKPTIEAVAKAAVKDINAASDMLMDSLHDRYLKIKDSITNRT